MVTCTLYYFYYLHHYTAFWANTFLCDLAGKKDREHYSDDKKYMGWPSVSFFLLPSNFQLSECFHLECKSAFQQRWLWLSSASSWVKFQPTLKVFGKFLHYLVFQLSSAFLKAKSLWIMHFSVWDTLCHLLFVFVPIF